MGALIESLSLGCAAGRVGIEGDKLDQHTKPATWGEKRVKTGMSASSERPLSFVTVVAKGS